MSRLGEGAGGGRLPDRLLRRTDRDRRRRRAAATPTGSRPTSSRRPSTIRTRARSLLTPSRQSSRARSPPPSAAQTRRASGGRGAVDRGTRGAIVVTRTLDEAIDLANRIAPEHRGDRHGWPIAPPRDTRAGTVFVGRSARRRRATTRPGRTTCCPTGGAARVRGGLSAADFVRVNSVQRLTRRVSGGAGAEPSSRWPTPRGSRRTPRRWRGACCRDRARSARGARASATRRLEPPMNDVARQGPVKGSRRRPGVRRRADGARPATRPRGARKARSPARRPRHGSRSDSRSTGAGATRSAPASAFLDHMLELVARHGAFDLTIDRRPGDLDVDQHHTVEDVGIALGEAVSQALGSKRGINRAGYFVMPMDETLGVAAVDLSGRVHAVDRPEAVGRARRRPAVGAGPRLLRRLRQGARANVHLKVLYGRSSHHQVEALFKAFARALRVACSRDRQLGEDAAQHQGAALAA